MWRTEPLVCVGAVWCFIRIRAYFLAVVVLCNLWGLVFACCLCVQVVYIAELNQSVSAFSYYRCSWLHLLRPLLINSGRTRFCILDPEIH
jgi:hypothetical protein